MQLKYQISLPVKLRYTSELRKIKPNKNILTDFILGAYVPLTNEGNIMVNGILASCYATFDHDLAHLVMTPIQLFPTLIEWIFGQDDGIQGFVTIAKTLGRYLTPNIISKQGKVCNQ